MSHLYEEVQKSPKGVTIGGPLAGAISKAPAEISDLAAVVLRQVVNRDTGETIAAVLAGGAPEFQGCRWEPRVTLDAITGDAQIALPAVGDQCLVMFDDYGDLWIVSWWPY